MHFCSCSAHWEESLPVSPQLETYHLAKFQVSNDQFYGSRIIIIVKIRIITIRYQCFTPEPLNICTVNAKKVISTVDVLPRTIVAYE